MVEEPNFLAHAFRSQYNLIGLATALGFAALSGNGLPLFIAAGIELVVLPLVSANPRFQRLVRAREMEGEQSARVQAKQAQLIDLVRQLPEGERQRYRALETLSQEIRQNYKSLDASSRALLDELVEKLDFLLAFYLRMRYSMVKMEAYFRTTDAERLDERIAMLDHEIARSPDRVREIKNRTKGVLLKRKERFAKALENRQVIEAQTETVLEVFQLLRDQSFAMRDPKEISAQLDGLVSSAEETERGVRDMEALMSLDQDLSRRRPLGRRGPEPHGPRRAHRRAAHRRPTARTDPAAAAGAPPTASAAEEARATVAPQAEARSSRRSRRSRGPRVMRRSPPSRTASPGGLKRISPPAFRMATMMTPKSCRIRLSRRLCPA